MLYRDCGIGGLLTTRFGGLDTRESICRALIPKSRLTGYNRKSWLSGVERGEREGSDELVEASSSKD